MCVSKTFGGLNCPLLLYIDVVRNNTALLDHDQKWTDF